MTLLDPSTMHDLAPLLCRRHGIVLPGVADGAIDQASMQVSLGAVVASRRPASATATVYSVEQRLAVPKSAPTS